MDTARWPNTRWMELREAIIMGELPAGTPLRLDELARSLGMSISPIREAVRQLEALGLAKHVPHQGARVLDFDVDELRDLFQIRLALESLAVRRAAERFTDEIAEAARGAARAVRRRRGERRRARVDASAHRLPLHAVRRVAVAVARCADPAGVGSRGGSGPRSSRRRTARRNGTAATTRRCSMRAPRTIPRLRRSGARPPRAGERDFEHELGGRGIFDS